jgi:hypothetical protein
MRKLIYVTTDELLELFKTIDGKSASYIRFTYLNDAKVYARKKTFKAVHQFTKLFGTVNVNYTRLINNALLRNGLDASFKTTGISWAELEDTDNGCVGKRKTDEVECLRYYLTSRIDKFFADGKLTDANNIPELKPMVTDEDFNITKEDLEGTNEEVIKKITNKVRGKIRMLPVEKIKKVYLNGNIYKVVKSEEEKVMRIAKSQRAKAA